METYAHIRTIETAMRSVSLPTAAKRSSVKADLEYTWTPDQACHTPVDGRGVARSGTELGTPAEEVTGLGCT